MAVSDAQGSFTLYGLEEGIYSLAVGCREASRGGSHRVLRKTYSIAVPSPEHLFEVEPPADWRPLLWEPIDEAPADIARALQTPHVPKQPYSPDFDGDGVISDEELRAADEVASYLLTDSNN
jgi:hypothetical protein